jgi:hypothetical protein
MTLYQSEEPLSQIDCRNKYLELTNADFLMVVDDDEVIHRYDAGKFMKGLETAKGMLDDNPTLFTVNYIQQNGILNVLPRLLYLPNRFRYTGNHFHFNIDNVYHGAHSSKNMDGLTLKHMKWDEAGRTREWEKAFERYEIQQKFLEKQY